MSEIFRQFFSNHILMNTIFAWCFTQVIKVSLSTMEEKRFDFRWLISTGGMPSSHAAGVSALATGIGLDQGFDSVIFALAATFAVIVFFDAQGVRRSAGKQAKILNQVMEDIYWKGKIQEERLKELLGHTPIEVILGLIIGMLLAFILY